MENKMPFYLSKTIWASVVILIATLLGPFGINIDAGAQTELVDNLLAVATAISALVAIYGRVTATKTINPPTPPAS